MKSPELIEGGYIDSTDGGSLCKEDKLEDGGHVEDAVKAILAQLEQ